VAEANKYYSYTERRKRREREGMWELDPEKRTAKIKWAGLFKGTVA
jgi:hypothetical protein